MLLRDAPFHIISRRTLVLRAGEGSKRRTESDLITLTEARPGDDASFKNEIQDAFAVAVVDALGDRRDGPIPSGEVFDGALDARDAVVLPILCSGRKVGGAVLKIDAESHRHAMVLCFINSGEEGRGFGRRARLAIEQRYPEAISWQMHTFCFERGAIRFFINKFDFKIVDLFNKYHSDRSQSRGPDDLPCDRDAFQFEEFVKSSGPGSRRT